MEEFWEFLGWIFNLVQYFMLITYIPMAILLWKYIEADMHK